MRRVRTILTALACGALFLIATVGGCSGRNDAPVTHRDTSGAEKFDMPDKFDTIATKCDGHGGRVYESQNHGDTKASGLTARLDPTCPGGKQQAR